ncbi:MAG: SPOR domain-containing protein, partial [Candidatus Accumulibacter sp.]|nr:SPOR domain-containing protein [Accumulibacter sp.]
SEKASDKKIEKAAEKVPVKKVDKPAEKSPEVGTEDVGKPPPVDDAPHVSPTPVSKAPETVAAKPAGQQVILIGAFANAENARQLQGKIGSAGVNAYTEVLDTPDGKKTRVRAGPFPNREAADQALEKLKKIGVTGVVAGRQ